MKKFAFIFLTALLCAEETAVSLEKEQATKFGYFSFGGCGWVLPVMSPEAAVGLRKLTAKHAWDIQSGASLTGTYVWGQVSYLHFFIPTNTSSYASPYLGIGLSGGYARLKDLDYSFNRNSPYINVPITVGFQWGENQRNQFFQIQFSPLLITTASFGVGF
ncbi:MAG: hypothetical protein K1X28_08120 [Parachlamydiales bacterium]|nr:hypothetical protein [Parachlamydiales bacterium]